MASKTKGIDIKKPQIGISSPFKFPPIQDIPNPFPSGEPPEEQDDEEEQPRQAPGKNTVDTINDMMRLARRAKWLRGLIGGGGAASGGAAAGGTAAAGTAAAAGTTTAVGVGTAPAWVPVVVVAAVVIILILILILLKPSIPGFGGSESTTGAGTGTTPGTSTGGLDYTIPFRDSSVLPDNIRDTIALNWPNARLENFDTIVNEARNHNWNPSFLLTLWIEESGGQSVQASDPLGCDPEHPTNDIDVSLGCVFRSFDSYQVFADFMCTYSESVNSPCTFSTNPNFPGSIKSVYSTLVPSGPGALVSAPPSTTGSTTATCPLPGVPISCGSLYTPRGGCGHCNAAYAASYPSLCTYEGINYAEDIDGEPGDNIILPSINGESLIWRKIDESLSSASGRGVIIKYKGSTSDGTSYVIQYHHSEPRSGVDRALSGDVGARICTSNCHHVHVEFYRQPATVIQDYIDAAATLCV